MKPWKKSSRSASREILVLQGSRDKLSGLWFADRIFIPEKEKKPRPFLWFIMDALLLLMVTAGLFLLMITGFSLEVHVLFYPVLCLLCLLSAFLCTRTWKKRGLGPGIALLLLIVTAVILFFRQEAFLNGAAAFYYQMRNTLVQTYQESDKVYTVVGNAADLAVFLSFTAWGAALWFAFSIFKRENFLLFMLLLFPLFSLTVLCGGGSHAAPLFLLLFGILGCMSLTRSVRHKRLWGGDNAALVQKNTVRHQRLQKKNLLLVLSAALILSVPGFYLVRPLLGARLQKAEQVAFRVESRILSELLEILPEMTADQWNLEVKAVAGGVSDGALQDTEGYQLHGVEDLQLTVSKKPTETLYLKGFIGGRYTDQAWEGGYGSAFDGIAINWKIGGSPRLYIQNLPFLRTSYVLDQTEKGREAADEGEEGGSALLRLNYDMEPNGIRVERIHASDHYTYVPYGAFLNDYYEVEDGDGSVTGQNVNDDYYFFFGREEMEEILKTWEETERSGNILDQVETSYGSYCRSHYTEVADSLSDLQKRVEEVIRQEKLDPVFDRNQIIAWVRAFLAENYVYETEPEPLEEGEDFLTHFLYESRKGYSIHFASAGVELFRMFGYPSRYVVGYEAPAAIFSVQQDGSYTATLQDDNAQAWAEIYVDGIGWMPVDVTPGMVGTLEEVGPGGEKIRTYEYEEESLKLEEAEEEAPVEKRSPSQIVFGGLTGKINALLNRDLTVEQVIRGLQTILLTILAILLGIAGGRKICRDYGYDPFHRRSREERLVGIFRAYYRYLRKKGLSEETDSGSQAFLEFSSAYMKKRKKKVQEESLREIRDRIYACCYGDEKAKEADILKMRRLYRQLRR